MTSLNDHTAMIVALIGVAVVYWRAAVFAHAAGGRRGLDRLFLGWSLIYLTMALWEMLQP